LIKLSTCIEFVDEIGDVDLVIAISPSPDSDLADGCCDCDCDWCCCCGVSGMFIIISGTREAATAPPAEGGGEGSTLLGAEGGTGCGRLFSGDIGLIVGSPPSFPGAEGVDEGGEDVSFLREATELDFIIGEVDRADGPGEGVEGGFLVSSLPVV